LLFGGFRKVQARSSWFGYKTDIYRFYLLFFLIQFGFHRFFPRLLSGDGYWGVGAELLQGYNVLCVVVGAFHFVVVGYQNLLLLCVFGFVCVFRGDLLCCKN
jgi:hypothetical protein